MKHFLTVLTSILMVFPLFNFQLKPEMTFGDSFNGASIENSEFTSISFSRKEEEEILINGGVPKYSDISNRPNPCANVAGAIILGYYDKKYDELIENFTSARIIRDKVFYATQTNAVEEVMARLYTTMKTNITEGGTTVANFKSGLQAYVKDKGRNISYAKVISSQNLLENNYKAAIRNEQPVVLFVSKYTLISPLSLDAESGAEEFYKQHYIGNHTVVGYGIRIIRYYDDSDNLICQMDLLAVSTGYEHSPTGYILIDDYGTLVDGYAINIY